MSESGPGLSWVSSLGWTEESTPGQQLQGFTAGAERGSTMLGLLDRPAGEWAQRPSRAGRPREGGKEALEERLSGEVECDLTWGAGRARPVWMLWPWPDLLDQEEKEDGTDMQGECLQAWGPSVQRGDRP